MDIETLQGKKVEIADASTLSPRDLYLQICRNRDFEISLVWQRAIFLTAFLLGCFTAYGSLASLLLKGGTALPFEVVNAICFLVTLVGIVVSMVWIMMAKGSKAWYEVYEKATEAFVAMHQTALCNARDMQVAQSKWKDLIGNVAGVQMPDRSKCLISTKGGAYSVSRINVFIGQFAFVIWLLLSIGHICVAMGKMSDILCEFATCRWMIVILVAVLIVVYVWRSKFLKSGYLDK